MIRRLLRRFGPLGIEAEDKIAIQHCTILGEVRVGYRSYANLCTLRNVSIGRFCSIGRGCSIGAAKHRLDLISSHPSIAGPSNEERVVIGHDVWIGDQSIVLSGVTIGTGAVVGAGAVVTKDVAPYEIVGGIPAKLIKMRFDPATVDRLLASRWWEYGDAILGHPGIEEGLASLEGAEPLPEHFRRR